MRHRTPAAAAHIDKASKIISIRPRNAEGDLACSVVGLYPLAQKVSARGTLLLDWLPLPFQNDTEGVMSTVPRLCVPFSFIEVACPAGATSCSPSLFFTYSRNCKSYQVCGLRLLTIRSSSTASLDLLLSTTISFIRSFHARTECSSCKVQSTRVSTTSRTTRKRDTLEITIPRNLVKWRLDCSFLCASRNLSFPL